MGLPASAFSEDETLEFLGTKVRYIFPEFSFLAKGSSPKEKDRFDQGSMTRILNKEKLVKISKDAKSAGILVNVPPIKMAAIKKVL